MADQQIQEPQDPFVDDQETTPESTDPSLGTTGTDAAETKPNVRAEKEELYQTKYQKLVEEHSKLKLQMTNMSSMPPVESGDDELSKLVSQGVRQEFERERYQESSKKATEDLMVFAKDNDMIEELNQVYDQTTYIGADGVRYSSIQGTPAQRVQAMKLMMRGLGAEVAISEAEKVGERKANDKITDKLNTTSPKKTTTPETKGKLSPEMEEAQRVLNVGAHGEFGKAVFSRG
jgi:hypothetical protein